MAGDDADADATAGTALLREFGLDVDDASADIDVPPLPPRLPRATAPSTAAPAPALAAAALQGLAELTEESKGAWINERGAPEVLPFRQDLVDQLMEQMQTQKDKIDRDRALDPANAFVANLFYMEIERIKYVLRSYLKSRLVKIERFARLILDNDDLKARLSSEELRYASEYCKLLEKHMLAAGLKDLPEQLARLNTQETTNKPKLSTFVLCGTRRSIDGYALPSSSSTSIELVQGDILAMRYDDIAALIMRGDVVLL